jgi:hypothetical protein
LQAEGFTWQMEVPFHVPVNNESADDWLCALVWPVIKRASIIEMIFM